MKIWIAYIRTLHRNGNGNGSGGKTKDILVRNASWASSNDDNFLISLFVPTCWEALWLVWSAIGAFHLKGRGNSNGNPPMSLKTERERYKASVRRCNEKETLHVSVESSQNTATSTSTSKSSLAASSALLPSVPLLMASHWYSHTLCHWLWNTFAYVTRDMIRNEIPTASASRA